MSDRWIVSAYKFRMHPALDIAIAEHERLAALPKMSGVQFRVYRIKESIQPNSTHALRLELESAAADMVASFDWGGNPVDRLKVEWLRWALGALGVTVGQ